MSNVKKIVILTLTMIFAIAVSATVVSYSFAGGENLTSSTNEKQTVKAAAPLSGADDVLADTLTNIDHIIDKANDTTLPDSERIFHIVQIVSNGNKNTSLKSYVENGDFTEHVINANSSDEQHKMPKTFTGEGGTQATVQIDVLTVADMNALVTAASRDYSRVTIADLIVISNDPSKPFTSDNDIPEDIHKVLQPYAVGDYKPLIIDWAGSAAVTENPYSMNALATNVLKGNYIKFRTFKWGNNVTLENFLNRKGSVYIPLELEAVRESKVLVIYGDGNASAITSQLSTGTTFKDNAYYKRGPQPSSVKVERKSYTEIADASFADGYDFVFIENDTYDAMTADIYNAISVVSYAKKHVIYPEALEAAAAAPDTTNESNYSELLYTVASSDGISLYKNVMLSTYTFFDSMAADPAGTQEAANEVAELLKASTYREWGVNSASGKKYTVLELQPAYPIDLELAKKKDAYYTKPDNVYKNSKEMTPPDGEYYAFELTVEKIMALTGLKASDIDLVQMSVEEFQGIKNTVVDKYDLVYIGGNISALTDADSYNFVNGDSDYISQYISRNFVTIQKDWNGNSDHLLGTIYTDADGVDHVITKKGPSGETGWQDWYGYYLDGQTGYAFYQMYSHTGAYVAAADDLYGITANGDWSKKTVADTGGIDITSRNLDDLKAYIDAGMPIVFSDDITAAYKSVMGMADMYQNSMIDPDSNMFALLEYALNPKGVAGGKNFAINAPSNVLVDFDKDDTIRIANLTGYYGSSAISGSDYVEVFNDGELLPYYIKDAKGVWEEEPFTGPVNPYDATDTAGYELKTFIQKAVKRPTMNITKMPSVYVANTPSSYLQSGNLVFEFELLTNGNPNITGFTVYLYIDDDSNGLFTENEKVSTDGVKVHIDASGKGTGVLTYALDNDFYGPISWKLVAVADMAEGTGPSISYGAISKVVRTSSEKDLVHILQIIPQGSTQQSATTLYFCTGCQLYNTLGLYEGHLNSGAKPSDGFETYIGAMYQNYGASAEINSLQNTTSANKGTPYRFRSTVLKLIDEAKNNDQLHFGIGLHQHDFGLWKYDSKLQYDDWSSNLADTLSGEDGDFEFDIDIFCPEDLDAMNKEYCSAATNEVAALQEKYEKLKNGDDQDAAKAAKAAVDAKKAEKMNAAAEIYEEYLNLVTQTETVEKDVRNILQYLAGHQSEMPQIVRNSVTDWNVFSEVLESGDYHDLFSQNKTAWRSNDPFAYVGPGYGPATVTFTVDDKQYQLDSQCGFNYYYQKWADAKSYEVLKLEEYWEAYRASFGKDWMQDVYGVIVIGAAENFGEQDLTQSVCDKLKDYEAAGGNMLLFHDTMARTNKGAVNMTKTLRDAFGLNRYHMTASAGDSNGYTVDKGYDSSKYFLTRMSTYGDMMKYDKFNRSLIGMSTHFAVYQSKGAAKGVKAAPYKYAQLNLWNELTNWSMDVKTYMTNVKAKNFSSNRATQVNRGIITSYPFTISDKLNISLTHGQYLALDMEDDEVVTWYTLAGSDTNPEYGSMYAANPGDSADEYFIYTKGNVSYCGAGHAKVTGPLTDNNDERMLFINIICNSARKRALKPSLKIYDPDSKKVVPSASNKYILQNSDGEPYIEVSSMTDSIRFGFMATVDPSATIASARIYFKYDQNGDGEVDAKDDVAVIYNYGADVIDSGKVYYIDSTNKDKISDSIVLKPEYFDGYDEGAYVYVEVTDSNGEVLMEKIKIELVGDLFDMTDNSIENHSFRFHLQDVINDL
ncbi:MAG: DUF5057 domain-containing protein [Lachnospiraceae bacterium]|nr:DUF5057 domain-containing protein [Lachnospiraceae bacterium]